MDAEIQPPLTKKFSNMGSHPPRDPNRNYIPFENPQDKCAVPTCPNFARAGCHFCKLHCEKIHEGLHENSKNIELEKLLDKYLKETAKNDR